MVKPVTSLPFQPTTSAHNNISMHPGPSIMSGAGGGPAESGDFSFVVLERSPQESLSHTSVPSISNGLPTLNGASALPNFNMQSIENASLILSAIPDLSPDEVQKRLQDVLRENIELKETLQQNNLAMKQQFNTLITWQEDVVRVHQNHKEKFEETRSLIVKLKAENANLKMVIENQTDAEEIQSENKDLKLKLQMLEGKINDQESLIEDNIMLKAKLAHLESTSTRMNESQLRAERRVVELSEERVQLLRNNEELSNRAALLQSELATVQADSFIVIEHAQQAQDTRPVPKPVTPEQPREMKAPNPDEYLTRFYVAMDEYEELLMISYKRLDDQVDSFSQLYAWLQETTDKILSASPALDVVGLQTLLQGLMLRLKEAQAGSTGHRLRLEEAGQQLGRLSSDFQGLIQEWLSYSKERKEIQQHNSSYQDVQTSGFKEQIDHMTAQLLALQEKVSERDNALAQETVTLAQRDAKLSQLDIKLAQQEAKLTQKETELAQALKKLKTVEQNIDALTAQAEVYKMDFHEERESREALATEKERIVDDLRSLQQRNQTLLEQLEAKEKQLLEQTQQNQQHHSASVSTSVSRPQAHNYNTIATPGRGRSSQWLGGSEQTTDREASPPPQYECPKCQLHFTSLQPLQNHVEVCLELDMFP